MSPWDYQTCGLSYFYLHISPLGLPDLWPFLFLFTCLPQDYQTCGVSYFYLHISPLGLQDLWCFLFLFTYVSPGITRLVVFLISIYICLPQDYQTCGVSYFYLHVSLGLLDLWPFLFLFTYFSPGITRPVAFLISIYLCLPQDYQTCGLSYFYLHISPLGLQDLWCFLFLFTYVPPRITRPVAFLISIYICLHWDYQTCGISYFYLHMSPLGLLDLCPFLFLFTYVSPGITRPVAFLISIYICLPWDYQTCGLSYFYLHMSPLGLLDLWPFLFLFTYVSPGITRPVAFLISIYIYLPWDYKTCGVSYFYLHMSPLGLLDLWCFLFLFTYASPRITRPVAFLFSIYIFLPWDYQTCGVSYFYLHMPPLGLLDLWHFFFLFTCLPWDYQTCGVSYFYLHMSPLGLLDLWHFLFLFTCLPWDYQTCGVSYFYLHISPLGLQDLWCFLFLFTYVSPGITRPVVFLISIYICLPQDYQTCGVSYFFLHISPLGLLDLWPFLFLFTYISPGITRPVAFLISIYICLPQDYQTCGISYFYLHISPLGLQDLWCFLFLFTYVSPGITRPVAFLISIYIYLPWDYKTCGVSYFYLHMSPLGLLDLWCFLFLFTYASPGITRPVAFLFSIYMSPLGLLDLWRFLFLFTYVSPGITRPVAFLISIYMSALGLLDLWRFLFLFTYVSPGITRPVAFLISIYICLPWDQTCGVSDFYLHISPLGLLDLWRFLFLFTYVSPGIIRPVAFLISIYIFLPWDYQTCGISYFYLHMSPLGLLDLWHFLFLFTYVSPRITRPVVFLISIYICLPGITRPVAFLISIYIFLPWDYQTCGLSYFYLHMSPLGLLDLWHFLFLFTYISPGITRPVVFLISIYICLPWDYQTCGVSYFYLHMSPLGLLDLWCFLFLFTCLPGITRPVAFLISIYIFLPWDYQTCGLSYFYLHMSPLGLLDLWHFLFLFTYVSPGITRPVAFLISIYICLPWDYQTCGISYFYLHMSPLGLLDLWHFLFLFTYVSPRIIRPVAFLISIYIYLPWDYKTCGVSYFYLHMSPLGLLNLWCFLFLFTYVSPRITRPVVFLISIYMSPWDYQTCGLSYFYLHMSPLGLLDLWPFLFLFTYVSSGITRPVAFLISIYICLPWDYQTCALSYFYLHMSPLGLLDLWPFLFLFTYVSPGITRPVAFLISIYICLPWDYQTCGLSYFYLHMSPLGLLDLWPFLFLFTYISPGITRPVVFLISIYICLPWDYQTCGVSYFYLHMSPLGLLDLWCFLFLFTCLPWDYQTCGISYFYLHMSPLGLLDLWRFLFLFTYDFYLHISPLGLLDLWRFLFLFTYVSPGIIRPVAFLISIYIFLPWDYQTCGISYFYLHMSPLGLLDLWHFLFLFTYVSPRITRPVVFLISIYICLPGITRPVVFLISIYIYLPWDYKTCGVSYFYLHMSPLGLLDLWCFLFLFTYVSPRITRPVVFLISFYIFLPQDYQTCGHSYFYLHISPLGLLDLWPFLFLFTYVSPRITRPVAFLISIYIYLPWDYKTCGVSYFYLHMSPLGLLDLWHFLFLFTYISPGITRPVVFLISIYICLPWDYQTCGVSYFYLHMPPLGLLDLWHFFFLFTCLPWDYQTCGVSYFYLHMSPLGLLDLWHFLFLFTCLPWDYQTCGVSYFYLHMSPLGLLDLWHFLFLFTYVSPGIRPVAFLIFIYIYLPWDYQTCGVSYFYLHMSPLGLLDLWHFLFLFTYFSPGIIRPVAFLISIYICLPWDYQTCGISYFYLHMSPLGLLDLWCFLFLFTYVSLGLLDLWPFLFLFTYFSPGITRPVAFLISIYICLPQDYQTCGISYFYLHISPLGLQDLWCFLFLFTYVSPGITRPVVFLISIYICLPQDYQTCGVSYFYLHVSPGITRPVAFLISIYILSPLDPFLISIYICLPQDYQTCGLSYFYLHMSPLGLLDLWCFLFLFTYVSPGITRPVAFLISIYIWCFLFLFTYISPGSPLISILLGLLDLWHFLFLFTYVSPGITRPVAFLISIYICLPWDYQTCGVSYFYLHMSPLGLLDLWRFLFLFTYVSPGIIRPVAFLISIYIFLPWDYQTCGISYFYLHMSPLGLLDLWHFLFLFTYVSPRITRPVVFLISIYICLPGITRPVAFLISIYIFLPWDYQTCGLSYFYLHMSPLGLSPLGLDLWDYQTCGVSYFYLHMSPLGLLDLWCFLFLFTCLPGITRPVAFLISIYIFLPWDYQTCGLSYFYLHMSPLGLLDLWPFLFLFTYISPGITRPVVFLISIYICLPWDYQTCGISYFYLHMPPLGLLDLWHFLFLFTYVSPGIIRPVAFLISIYICLPWDYQTCGLSYFYLHMSPLGLLDLWPFLFLFTYVSPGIIRPVVSYFYLHMSPLGLLDLWCFLFLFTYVSPGIIRPVVFLISIYICLPQDYQTCGISFFYLHISPLGLLDLWHFLFLFTYVSPGITRPVAFLISIYICLPWDYQTCGVSYFYLHISPLGLQDLWCFLFLFTYVSPGITRPVVFLISIYICLPQDYQTCGVSYFYLHILPQDYQTCGHSYFYLHISPLGLLDLWPFLFLFTYVSPGICLPQHFLFLFTYVSPRITRPVAFLISIYICLPWDYKTCGISYFYLHMSPLGLHQTCGVSYFYLHMSPLGLLDLWHFLFLFTYVSYFYLHMSPLGLLDLWHFLFLFTYVSPGITRCISYFYLYLPWDYQTCGVSYFYLHMSPLGLLDLWCFLFLFTYVSPGITRPVAFLISIYICLPWDYQTCGVSYFYLHMPPLGLLDLSIYICLPWVFLISIYICLPWDYKTCGISYFYLHMPPLGLQDLWCFLFLFTYVSPRITRHVVFLISFYICLPWDYQTCGVSYFYLHMFHLGLLDLWCFLFLFTYVSPGITRPVVFLISIYIQLPQDYKTCGVSYFYLHMPPLELLDLWCFLFLFTYVSPGITRLWCFLFLFTYVSPKITRPVAFLISVYIYLTLILFFFRHI